MKPEYDLLSLSEHSLDPDCDTPDDFDTTTYKNTTNFATATTTTPRHVRKTAAELREADCGRFIRLLV